MLVFLDTEFTDFIQCEMISIGMVSSGGHEFYFEINDYDQKLSSEFVRYEIVPMLGKNGAKVGTKAECAIAVREYFNTLPYEKFTVIVDYYQDMALLQDLLEDNFGPKYAGAAYLQNLFEPMEANRAMILATEGYFADGGLRHHALHDAKANRAGWIAGMKKMGVF
jgi:hypothetical protein